jgi:hypothetical protein
MGMTRTPGSARWLVGLVAVVAVVGGTGLSSLGCGKKPVVSNAPPPELTGLAAVPATAEAVLSADIAKLAGSPVVDRVAEQVLQHNPELSDRWHRLKDDCKIDLVKQVKRVMLAIGPHPGPDPGTGPVLMIVVGSIAEAELKDCVAKLVGGGGGTLTGKAVSGRTLYLAKDGNRTMYFAYGRPDTIVLGSNEAYVTEALGTGKKAPDNPDLTTWLRLVNQNSSLWAVGRTDARVREGLVRLTGGKLSTGPAAYTAMADLSDGANLSLGVVMSQPEDAKNLESFVKSELALLTAAAQWKSLGAVVGKIAVSVEDDVVHFRAPLTVEDLNLLLSALDGGTPPAQDSPPRTRGSGSGPP